jgi:HSP20 family protein
MNRKSLLPSTASYWGVPALRRLRDDMDEMFESFFADVFKTPAMKVFEDVQTGASFPKINVSETDTAYGVDVAVAGFEKGDVNLELKDNTLFISADKKIEKEEEEKNYIRKEISSKSFRRAVRFPCEVTEDVSATYKDGIINIEIQKAVESEKEEGIKIDIE